MDVKFYEDGRRLNDRVNSYVLVTDATVDENSRAAASGRAANRWQVVSVG